MFSHTSWAITFNQGMLLLVFQQAVIRKRHCILYCASSSFTGFDSGELGLIVDVNLHVPSHSIEHVEDVHLVLEHLITKALREKAMAQVLDDSAMSLLTDIALDKENPSLD